MAEAATRGVDCVSITPNVQSSRPEVFCKKNCTETSQNSE